MFKKYFALFALSSLIVMPTFAADAVFSNKETQSIELTPVSSTGTSASTTQTKVITSTLSEQNFVDAVTKLDNAEVELREQLSSYSALMAQAKTNYETKRDEYRGYKKEYNSIKKVMRSVEKSKKLIQKNIASEASN